MTDFAVSVFRLTNQRGYSVPPLNIGYLEESTGLEWRLTCGGSRAYAVRFGLKLDEDPNLQAEDSHFMVRRITSALLVAGAGLFQAEAVGRIFFKKIEGDVTWTVHLDQPDPLLKVETSSIEGRYYDWIRAICKHNILRRAIDDAHLALTHPHEALLFVYRGLEWLKVGQSVEWDDIADDIGVPADDLRELKKTANYETGVRHASKTGGKLRASVENYGTWVAGLFHAINAARARVEKDFEPMTTEQITDAVMRAVPVVPYP